MKIINAKVFISNETEIIVKESITKVIIIKTDGTKIIGLVNAFANLYLTVANQFVSYSDIKEIYYVNDKIKI